MYILSSVYLLFDRCIDVVNSQSLDLTHLNDLETRLSNYPTKWQDDVAVLQNFYDETISSPRESWTLAQKQLELALQYRLRCKLGVSVAVWRLLQLQKWRKALAGHR